MLPHDSRRRLVFGELPSNGAHQFADPAASGINDQIAQQIAVDYDLVVTTDVVDNVNCMEMEVEHSMKRLP